MVYLILAIYFTTLLVSQNEWRQQQNKWSKMSYRGFERMQS